MLWAVGEHLGHLAGVDLRAAVNGERRSERKRALTAQSSSRWAGALTRTSDDQVGLSKRNQVADQRSLRRAITHITVRLTTPVGEGHGRRRGYASQAERFAKQGRLQVLRARLVRVDEDRRGSRVRVVRGGRRLAGLRHHLEEAGLTAEQWRARWRSRRLFLCADGEGGKALGNETIRWDPHHGIVEIRLPSPLAVQTGTPRLRLGVPVTFPHRGEEVAARAQTRRCIRYDITHDPIRDRWYLGASWGLELVEVAHLPGQMLAVDLNAGHLAAHLLDEHGNPTGRPITVPLELAGLPSSQRDGRLQAAITTIIRIALAEGCTAIAVENLDFADARETGREQMGRGPHGKRFRRTVAGLPTARVRDRLVAMASRFGLAVIGVDPAYTSRWGDQHWLAALNQVSAPTSPTRHHAAAVVIGRRALRLTARRRPGVPGAVQRIRTGELPARPRPQVASAGPRAAAVRTRGTPAGEKTPVAGLGHGRGQPGTREDRWPSAPPAVTERR